MDDRRLFSGTSGASGEHTRLAQWLQQVLAPMPQTQALARNPQEKENHVELVLSGDYHVRFYRQLPDFAMAVLQNDTQAVSRFADLLCHLSSCQECHHSYLDIYDSLRDALDPQGTRPLYGQGTRTLAATPHRMLGHFCQILISQAEAELRQARHDHEDRDVPARSLLQMALHISAHITQGTVRREALQDLVRVATLFDGAPAAPSEEPDLHTFTPVVAGGMRRGKVLRRSDASVRAQPVEPHFIELQARGINGQVVQQGSMLELHLQDLNPSLYGRHVTISVLLGSLLEPVRWSGGNPRAIQSAHPVDETGTLIVPLGETDFQLSNPEERNLLEALFLLLEVRPA